MTAAAMERRKLLFVYNPFSGKGDIVRSLHEVIAVFTAAGYDVTVHPTSEKGDGRDFIRDCGGEYDLVCTCGGDGTLHELFEGIKYHKGKRCGYIPAGTMNDFAGSLCIPKDIPEAAKMIVGGNFRDIDAGVLGGERFAYVAAFGAFSEVSYSTDNRLKNVFGSFAYFLQGVKLFDINYFDERSVGMKITCGDEVFIGDFIFGMAGNSLSVAGMTKLISAGAEMDDGLLDCLFIRRPRNLSDIEKTRAALLDEGHTFGNVVRLRTDRLVIESDKPIEWDLDGEFGGSTLLAEISIEPRAVTIAVPESKT